MRKKKLKLLILFGLLSSLVFLNCKETEEPMVWTVEFDTETFYREWAAWEDQGIT